MLSLLFSVLFEGAIRSRLFAKAASSALCKGFAGGGEGAFLVFFFSFTPFCICFIRSSFGLAASEWTVFVGLFSCRGFFLSGTPFFISSNNEFLSLRAVLGLSGAGAILFSCLPCLISSNRLSLVVRSILDSTGLADCCLSAGFDLATGGGGGGNGIFLVSCRPVAGGCLSVFPALFNDLFSGTDDGGRLGF